MEPDYLDHNGETISADSLRARMSAEHQRQIDDKLSTWFANEYNAFNVDDVMAAGKRAY